MVMAYTPEEKNRIERLKYLQSHLVPIAAVITIAVGLIRLAPHIKKLLKN